MRYRDLPVGGIDAAAWENKLSRHEFMAVMAAAHQDLRLLAGMVEDDQRRRGPRPQIRMFLGDGVFALDGFGIIRPLDDLRCSRSVAHIASANFPRHGRATETVHTQGPLPADQRAFDARQQRQRQGKRENEAGDDRHPYRRIGPAFLANKQERADNVADYQDGEIGRRVIGAVVVRAFAILGLLDVDSAGVCRCRQRQHRDTGAGSGAFAVGSRLHADGAARIDEGSCPQFIGG